MLLAKLEDFRLKRLKNFASTIGVRFLGVYFLEAIMTTLILLSLAVDDMAQYAFLLGVFALIECLSLSVIDKVLFKKFRPGTEYFSEIFRLKIFGNLLIFGFSYGLLLFLGDTILSMTSVSSIDEWPHILFFLSLYKFLTSTTHPVISVGPIYKISFPYLFAAIGNKLFPLMFFIPYVITSSASLYSLSAALCFGAVVIYPINIFLYRNFEIRRRRKAISRAVGVKVLVGFWGKNLPNNFLDSFEKRGIYLLLGFSLSETEMATYFAISRVTNMMLFGRSLVKQAGMFLLSGVSIEWFIGQFNKKLYLLGAYFVSALVFMGAGIGALAYLSPAPISFSVKSILLLMFAVIPLFYVNPVLRALLTINLRVADLFLGNLVKNLILLIFVMLSFWTSTLKLEIVLLGVTVSMVVFTISNVLLFSRRREHAKP